MRGGGCGEGARRTGEGEGPREVEGTPMGGGGGNRGGAAEEEAPQRLLVLELASHRVELLVVSVLSDWYAVLVG